MPGILFMIVTSIKDTSSEDKGDVAFVKKIDRYGELCQSTVTRSGDVPVSKQTHILDMFVSATGVPDIRFHEAVGEDVSSTN